MKRRSINRHISTSSSTEADCSFLQCQSQFETLTGDALAFLIDGVMRRAWSVNRSAQFLRFLVGGRFYKLNRRLKDTELQSHSHLWEKKDLCHVRANLLLMKVTLFMLQSTDRLVNFTINYCSLILTTLKLMATGLADRAAQVASCRI